MLLPQKFKKISNYRYSGWRYVGTDLFQLSMIYKLAYYKMSCWCRVLSKNSGKRKRVRFRSWRKHDQMRKRARVDRDERARCHKFVENDRPSRLLLDVWPHARLYICHLEVLRRSFSSAFLNGPLSDGLLKGMLYWGPPRLSRENYGIT